MITAKEAYSLMIKANKGKIIGMCEFSESFGFGVQTDDGQKAYRIDKNTKQIDLLFGGELLREDPKEIDYSKL